MIVASATVRSNFCGLSAKPGATMVAHQERHRQFHEDGDRSEHGEQNAEHFFGKALGAVHAVGFDLLGKQRHEGGVEGAFGEQPAKRVGKLEGGVEGVGDRPGAERCGHQHLAA